MAVRVPQQWSRTLSSRILEAIGLLVPEFFSWHRPARRRTRRQLWTGGEPLEQRQLLTVTPMPVNTEVQIYNGMGIQCVSIALPPDAVSFQSLTFNPVLGTAVPDSSGSLSVLYQYTSSGVDSFGISYLDSDGAVQTQTVNILIFDDYTGTVLLDIPDPQSEQDFLSGLYSEFINPPDGSGTGTGSGYGGGNGAGPDPGSGSGQYLSEISVFGKGLLIVDGDTTPSSTDDTDYGVVNPGQTLDHTFTVTNSGDAPLSLQLQLLPSGWMVTESLTTYLPPTGSDTFTVQFTPSWSGQYTAEIIIDNNDYDENPYSFFIRGVTSAPEIGVSGNGVVIVDGDTTPGSSDGTDFGSISVGQFADRIFTVNNSGAAMLTLQLPQLPPGFSITEQLDSQLAPSDSDTFTVRFSPSTPGSYSGQISIGNNDSDENPFNFAIRGTTSGPEIDVRGGGVEIVDGDSSPGYPDGTYFGIINSGQTVSNTFTVLNSGTSTLSLQAPQLPAGFEFTESLVSQLAPGTSDTFTVLFSPATPGYYTGEIVIGNNDADEAPTNFAISGVMGGPEINVFGNGFAIVDGDTTPVSADDTWFGAVGPGQTVEHSFVVNNSGTATLSLSLRPLPAGFFLVEPLTSSLPGGGTDTFTVGFAPGTAGQYGGEVTIDNNDADENPYNFAIFGMLGTPEIDVLGNNVSIADGDNTPRAADNTYFGMTPPNIVVSRTFTVRNEGMSTLHLGQVSLGPGSGFRRGGDALVSRLEPGQSDTFSIELVSATPGTYTRTVTIYNNDSNEYPYDFAIRGIVGAPEIDVTGKGVGIVDGDIMPNTYDDTDFGTVQSGTTVSRTFTVKNTGTGTLYLGSPSVTGTGFLRGAKVLRTYLEPGESDTFDVRFSSITSGIFWGELTLYNSDANEWPYNFRVKAVVNAYEITLSNNTVPEATANTTVGTFSTTGGSASDSFTYSLAPGGPDNLAFVIEGATLKTVGSFNYEAKSSYQISVTSTSQWWGLSVTKTFQINVVNKKPVVTLGQAFSTDEDAAGPVHTGPVAITIDSTAGANDIAAFQLSGSDATSFAIDQAGQISVTTPLDFESKSTYTFQVTATDKGGFSSDPVDVSVTVTNVNEMPTDITLTPATIEENHGNPSHIPVGDLTATDPDGGDTHTFTLDTTFGDAAKFSVGGRTVYAKQPFDFEDAHGPTYSIKVTATDTGGLTFTKTLTITVTNVNEAPAIDPNQQFSVDENAAAGTTVGTVNYSDPDAGDTHTFVITSGNTGNTFAINNAGVIEVQTPGALNFETITSFTLTITVTDSGTPALSDTETVVVNITDKNEAPLITDLNSKVQGSQRGSASFDFGPQANNTVTVVTANDEDSGDQQALIFTMTKTSGPPGFDPFVINQVTGAVVWVGLPVWLGPEAGLYSYQVSVTDPGGLQDTGSITIEVKLQHAEVEVVDAYAVEGTTDSTLEIVFSRSPLTSLDNSLTVSFSTTAFNSADFVADADAAIFFAGSIDIAAGSTTAPLTLTVLPNVTTPPEVIEEGTIRVLTSIDYFTSGREERLTIYDGVKLFIDGRPGTPDGHVVDRNDVMQGGHGDCFLLSVLANLAEHRPDFVTTMVRSVPSTPTPLDFQVRFYSIQGNPYWVDVTLDLNTSGVRLNSTSTDHDGTNAEVWVKVIEQAYINAFISEDWFPADAYQNLTGQNGNTNVIYTSDAGILADIAAAIAAGNGVIWGTGPSPATLSVPLHAYSVSRVVTDPTTGKTIVVVYNPHGGPNSEESIPEDLLWENLGALTILEGRDGL